MQQLFDFNKIEKKEIAKDKITNLSTSDKVTFLYFLYSKTRKRRKNAAKTDSEFIDYIKKLKKL
jgi:hypothetical protein